MHIQLTKIIISNKLLEGFIVNIHIISFNIHKGRGWGITRSTLNQIHNSLCTLHPDIIFLQEIRGAQFEILSAGLWPHFSYGKNAVYPKGHHGNAILSKFPIEATDNIDLSMHRYESRGLLHSYVKVTKNNLPLHLLCVHLGLFINDRRKQLDKIVSYIRANIPENEPIILSGDFNDWNVYATIPLINTLGFHEAFLSKHGSYARSFPAWAPILKLDRIYYRGLKITNAHRLVKKPWKYFSDHIALEVYLEYGLESHGE